MTLLWIWLSHVGIFCFWYQLLITFRLLQKKWEFCRNLQHYANQLLIEVDGYKYNYSDKLSRSRSYNDLYLDVTFWDMESNISIIYPDKNKFFFTEHTVDIDICRTTKKFT